MAPDVTASDAAASGGNSGSGVIPPDWSVYAAPVNALLLAAEQFGAKRADLLDRIGLDASSLSDPEARIALTQYFHLFKLAEKLTGNSDIALYAGRIGYLGGLNLQLYMATICHTFRDYLNLMPSVLKMWGDIGEVKIKAAGDMIRLEWLPLADATTSDRYLTDAVLAASAAIVDSLCLLPVPVRRAEVTYAQPANTDVLGQLFGAEIEFEADISCLYFARQSLDFPLVQQNYQGSPGGRGSLVPFADLFDGKDPSDKFWSRLRQSIVRLLPLGDLSMSGVASDMNMSARTFQRHMQQRGTCFRDEVKDIRSQLAVRYLADPNISVTDAAFLLGYSDQGAFSNAFKSWHGCAPSDFRVKTLLA